MAETKKKAPAKKPVEKKAEPKEQLIRCEHCQACRDDVAYGCVYCTAWGRATELKGYCFRAVPKE